MTPLSLTLVFLGTLAQGAPPATDPLATALAELRGETRRLEDERAVRAPERRQLLDRLAELRYAALESERRVADLEAQAKRLRTEAATAEDERNAAASHLAEARKQAAALSAAVGSPDLTDVPDAATRKALQLLEARRGLGNSPPVTEADIETPGGSPRLADELRLGTSTLRVARDGSVMAVGVPGPDGTLRWEHRVDWFSLRTARQALAAARRQRPAEIMLLPVGLP